MDIAAKLFTYFLLPPGLIVTVLLFGAFIYRRGFAYAALTALFVWVISTDLAANALIGVLEKREFNQQGVDPVAVVVLGGGEDEGVLFPLAAGATERVLAAWDAAVRLRLPLVYSGFEWEKAKRELEWLDRGFCKKPSEILYEKRSLNTYQNAKYCAEMFDRMGWPKRVVLVTSAYHMPRSVLLFEGFGFEVLPVKSDFKTSVPIRGFSSFLPKMSAFRASYTALHEYIGIVYSLIRLK